jgi:hypothetical protein
VRNFLKKRFPRGGYAQGVEAALDYAAKKKAWVAGRDAVLSKTLKDPRPWSMAR